MSCSLRKIVYKVIYFGAERGIWIALKAVLDC